MNKKFSVLISLYITNDPEYFKQAMISIFDQTYQPTEVILVIDGEKTKEQQNIIDYFQCKYINILKIIQLDKNIGQGAALNEGLKYCSYELVARMDTDDISKETRFEKQISIFERNPEIDIVSSWVDEFFELPNDKISIRKIPEKHFEIEKYAKYRCPLNHPAVMYKKSKVIMCGGYEQMGLLDDYILWVKMLKMGAVFYNIQESLLYYRLGKDMYKRRGGVKYAIDECKSQWFFFQNGIISLQVALGNIFVRCFVRIMPEKVRMFLYKNILRKQDLKNIIKNLLIKVDV